MDSGSVVFDLESDGEFDVPTDISAEEMIWLMDELLCREVLADPSTTRERI